MGSRRIYLFRETSKYAKLIGGAIVTITGLFAVLLIMGFTITGSDDTCDGTPEDPCISYGKICNTLPDNYDIYNPDGVALGFSPEIKEYWMFFKDGRVRKEFLQAKGIQHSTRGWRYENFTNDTKPRKNRLYVHRFAAYTCQDYMLVGLKNNPTDRVKWNLGIRNEMLDPIWDYKQTGSTPSLVLELHLDNCSAQDTSGNGNNGTVTGATCTNKGKFKGAYEFDGAGDYINISDDNTLNFGTGNFTISGWIKTPASAKKNYRTIISKGYTPGWWIQTDVNGKIIFGPGVGIAVTSVKDVFDNKWHHFVALRSGTDTNDLKLYIDGIYDAQGTGGENVNNAVPITIGEFGDLPGRVFNGTIDEVKIYNRTLTQSEILELYNESRQSHLTTVYGSGELSLDNDVNLVGHWKMDGNVLDETGTHDGTVTGAITTNKGKFKGAYEFDGDDWITMSGTIGYDENVSASWWAYANEDSSGYRRFFTLDDNELSALLWTGTDEFQAYYPVAGSLCGSDYSPSLGVWHHYVISYNGTDLLMYVDADFKKNCVIGADTKSGTLLIGRHGVGQYWNGLIDEVRIYNRSLSASEIRQLYNESIESHQFTIYGSPDKGLIDETGLVGHWKFNGDALDSSGEGNDATVYAGSPTIVNTCKYKQCYYLRFWDFNTVGGDILSAADDDSLDVTTHATFTFWFKHAGTNKVNPYIFNKGWGGIGAWRIGFFGTSGNIHFQSRNETTTTIVHDFYTTTNFDDTKWHHVAVVFNDSIPGINKVWIYVDGVNQSLVVFGGATRNFDVPMYANVHTLYLGGNPNSRYFNGWMDELRIYNRSLSVSEIQALYNESIISHKETVYGSADK